MCTRKKEHVRKGNADESENAKHCREKDHKMNWDEKKVIDSKPHVWARRMKETFHSIKDENHINSISYHLPSVWFPNIKRTILTILLEEEYHDQ